MKRYAKLITKDCNNSRYVLTQINSIIPRPSYGNLLTSYNLLALCDAQKEVIDLRTVNNVLEDEKRLQAQGTIFVLILNMFKKC